MLALALPVLAEARQDAFSHPLPGLDEARQLDFQLGKALFEKLWVAAPASTRGSDGLGPLANARSCADCHRHDGRGRLPLGTPAPRGLVLRLTRAGGGPDPIYGAQLQDHAAPGLAAEGRIDLSFTDHPVTLEDGTSLTLRRPRITIADPAHGPLAPDLAVSPRLAPPLIGLGLVAAIPDAAILSWADPEDSDGDGISGRAHLLPGADGTERLGRFGWTADQAGLEDQAASAFALDLGLSSPLRPDPWGDCTPAQTACRAVPTGEDPGLRDGREVSAEALALVAFYTAALAPPRLRNTDLPEVVRGSTLFAETGCAACHVPAFALGPSDLPVPEGTVIRPHSDFLLHDMGPDLADIPGREWRTPPLWGLGLTETVTGTTELLHDGRARSPEEAILWHGGEGQGARDAYARLSAADRAALLAYLESL